MSILSLYQIWVIYSLVTLIINSNSFTYGDRRRLINGTKATQISLFPYQVYLDNGKDQCTGVIISLNWVLTAAHCCATKTTSSYKLRVGSINKLKDGKVLHASKVIQHPQYQDKSFTFDICAIQISDQLERFTDEISNATIGPFPTSPLEATVAGWGKDRKGQSQAELRWGKINISFWDTLSHKIHDLFCLVPLESSTICPTVFSIEDQIALCNGDSGSGICTGQGKESQVFGIAVASSINCTGFSQFVDLNVPMIRSFIKDVTEI